MMIFVTTTDALADEKLYEKAYSLIPEYRRVKADKMKMRENKLQTVTFQTFTPIKTSVFLTTINHYLRTKHIVARSEFHAC